VKIGQFSGGWLADMILNRFDKSFLINLDDDAKELAISMERLAQQNIQVERIPGVAADAKGCYRTLASRGCVASHRRAVELAKERGYQSVLIFEDDIVFRRDFQFLWAKIERDFDKIEYDLFYFYRWRKIAWKPWGIRIVPIEKTLCTHAYAVHSRFYDKALGLYARNESVGTPADQLFDASNARIYAPTYNLIGQDEGFSRRKNRRTKRRWSAYTNKYGGVGRILKF
jgi:hypothetical protein